MLPDGRMHIAIEGGERFRLLELHDDRSFLEGTVEPVTDEDDPPAAADVEQVLELFRRLQKTVGSTREPPLADSPLLDFEIVSRVDFGNAEKQELIELTSPHQPLRPPRRAARARPRGAHARARRPALGRRERQGHAALRRLAARNFAHFAAADSCRERSSDDARRGGQARLGRPSGLGAGGESGRPRRPAHATVTPTTTPAPPRRGRPRRERAVGRDCRGAAEEEVAPAPADDVVAERLEPVELAPGRRRPRSGRAARRGAPAARRSPRRRAGRAPAR